MRLRLDIVTLMKTKKTRRRYRNVGGTARSSCSSDIATRHSSCPSVILRRILLYSEDFIETIHDVDRPIARFSRLLNSYSTALSVGHVKCISWERRVVMIAH